MPQVPAEVRAERAAALRALGARLHDEYVEQRLGSVAGVLVEELTGDGSYVGTSEDYLRVRIESACRPGEVVRVRLHRATDGTLLGRPV
jgi:tRNA A37 methylthiotransferase MiaB